MRRLNAESWRERGTLRIPSTPCVRWIIAIPAFWAQCSPARRVTADIIADGVHLDPAIVKLFALAKGPEQTVLISDATAATGMPDGTYHLGSMTVEVHDGKCMSNGSLAGSVLTMDRAVRNLARFAEWDLEHAVAAATGNPARVARIADKGVLKAGAHADFVVLTPQGEVLRTFVGGIECSR